MRDPGVLLDAVNRVGVRNISTLAREAGLPQETTRYWIHRRLPRLGLYVQIHPQYARLGLQPVWADLEFAAGHEGHAGAILDEASNTAYLVYRAAEMPARRWIAQFAVPPRHLGALEELLNELVELGVLTAFHIDVLTWQRRIAFNPRCYDFRHGSWQVDWRRIAQARATLVEPDRWSKPVQDPEMDRWDFLILKELQIDAGQHLSEIAEKLRASRRVLQYHYQRHVRPELVQALVRWRARDLTHHRPLLLCARLPVADETALRRLRQPFARVPFLEFEGATNDAYFTICVLPSGEIAGLLEYLRETLSLSEPQANLRFLNYETSWAHTIAYQLWDDREGWTFDKSALLGRVVPYLRRTPLEKKAGGS